MIICENNLPELFQVTGPSIPSFIQQTSSAYSVEIAPFHSACWLKPFTSFMWSVCPHPHYTFENQPHTQQVTNPEKSIAQGDIIDELQTSCLSAGNMDWIRESSYHAGFSKGDLALNQRCLNTWSALKTNIDWPPLES